MLCGSEDVERKEDFFEPKNLPERFERERERRRRKKFVCITKK